MKTQKKEIYLEIIRIIAIFFVVFNHTNGYGFFYFTKTDNIVWYAVSLFCSILCKVAVPLFFMISGYLLLGKKESLRTVLIKRILRYSIVIVIATAFTYIVTEWYRGGEFSVRNIVKMVYRGSDIGTYWYLYAYLGILLMLPFLRGCALTITKESFVYIFILRILLVGLLPILIFGGLGYHMATKIDSPILEQSLFYSLIGYYLGYSENMFKNRKMRLVGSIASFLCISISACVIYYEYLKTGSYSEQFLQGLLPVVCITIFGLVRYYASYISSESKLWNIIEFIGDKTFGVYLLEPTLRIFLADLQMIFRKAMPEFVASLVWCLVFVVVGIIITTILKMVPFLKKLL